MSAAAHCRDLESISSFLGFAPQNLYYLVAQRDNLYRQVRIPKRSTPGAWRQIFIPCTELKGVQRQILTSILYEHEPSQFAYAYVKGRSLSMAAKKLVGRQSILKIDLQNFFPSINERRVFGLFRSIGFNDLASWIFTNLVVHRGFLCQGAPTSPFLSNLICRNMDAQLNLLSNEWGLNYLRYSDDLFFYGPKYFRYKVFSGYVRRVISSHSFRINNSKTKYYPIGRPRFTLGLATHGDNVQLPRKTRKSYRGAFFRAARNLKWASDNLDRLNGMAEWYRAVYGEDAQYKEYRMTIENVRHIKVHERFNV